MYGEHASIAGIHIDGSYRFDLVERSCEISLKICEVLLDFSPIKHGLIINPFRQKVQTGSISNNLEVVRSKKTPAQLLLEVINLSSNKQSRSRLQHFSANQNQSNKNQANLLSSSLNLNLQQTTNFTPPSTPLNPIHSLTNHKQNKNGPKYGHPPKMERRKFLCLRYRPQRRTPNPNHQRRCAKRSLWRS